ncbi:MAG TPA: hypothetical protein VLE53_09460 [Gemmatimonadaceae bacterium]|nr:hypothetical protein [Gemmatimonadaceae bacterium]
MGASTARRSRILAVTGGLAITGAVIGAVLAPLLLWVVGSLLRSGARVPTTPAGFGLAALVGAALGVVLLPATAWWLMRHVPLGRALLGTVVGTLVGGGIGMFASALHPTISIGGALAGYLGSALLVRRRARARLGADRAPSAIGDSPEDE